MYNLKTSSAFLNYLASLHPGEASSRLPSLAALSKQLGVSVSVLREQLEVARALGLVDVRPRTGIRRLPYSFFPAVKQSLAYAIRYSPEYFLAFADLRNHLEECYWRQAVPLLRPEDHHEMEGLVSRAWEKLHGTPIQIPHAEHRQLHLSIFSRLENPFVMGILEAYWDAYEAVGLSMYADYDYLQQVWDYHQRMVAAILAGDLDLGYQLLVEHQDLIYHTPVLSMDGHSQAVRQQTLSKHVVKLQEPKETV